MHFAGYQQWIEVFDEDISKIWLSERKELQKAGMLLGAFERELKSNMITGILSQLKIVICRCTSYDRKRVIKSKETIGRERFSGEEINFIPIVSGFYFKSSVNSGRM